MHNFFYIGFSIIFFITFIAYYFYFRYIDQNGRAKELLLVFIANLFLSLYLLIPSVLGGTNAYYIAWEVWNKYDIFTHTFMLPVLQILWVVTNIYIAKKLFVQCNKIKLYRVLYSINFFIMLCMIIADSIIWNNLNDADTYLLYSLIIVGEAFIFMFTFLTEKRDIQKQS